VSDFKYIIFFAVIIIGIPIGVAIAKRNPRVEKFFWFLLLFFTAKTEDINFFSMETYRGTSKGFEIGLVDITAMIIFFLILSRRDKNPIQIPTGSFLYLLYFLFSCISIINSDVYIYSFFELWKMIRMYFYFFVIYNLIRSFEDIEEFIKYMAIIIFFITFLVLKQKYIEGIFQTTGPFPHQNSLVMYLLLYGALFLSYLPENETLSTWFQRSGSLMVVIAIIAEFKLFSLNDYFDLNDTRVFGPVDLPATYKSIYKAIIIVALISMVIGTIIWGYGDIIIKNT